MARGRSPNQKGNQHMSRGNEPIPPGLYPLSEPPPDSLFIHDTRQAAELLGVPPVQIMRLARSGKLLFKYVEETGTYQCSQADVDSYQQETAGI